MFIRTSRPVFLVFLVAAGLASATTFNVTRTTDNNGPCTAAACSLREAIIAANNDASATAANPHIINVPAGTYLLTIPGIGEDASLTGDLDILNHMTVRGVGAATTIIDGGHLASDTANTTGILEQVLQIPSTDSGDGRNLTVRLEGLTIRGGAGDTHSIWSIGSNLTISLCNIIGHTAQFFNIQGLATTTYPSLLTIDQSTVTGSGIAVNNDGNDNGSFASGSKLVITNSTIGNVNNFGYGVYFNGSATLTNTTVTGTAEGIASAPTQGNIARISHSTFYQNGIDVWPVIGTLYMKNTILASQTPCDTAAFSITSLGNNLFSSTRTNLCGGTLLSTDRVVDVALLHFAPLASNGGATQTFRLQAGSTAIDTGVCTDTLGATVATDQRGVVRPQDGNGNGTFLCDVGAYETRTPETTVDALAAYNNGIKHGTLVGVGTGSQITANQATFLGYLTLADTDVRGTNNYPAACAVLKTAIQASDGKTVQPDLITGSGLATFNALLTAVRVGLGC